MYAKKAGAPASKDTNMLKVENPYFDAKSKLHKPDAAATSGTWQGWRQKRDRAQRKGQGGVDDQATL